MFSIVIPTINEEKNICLTIKRLLKIFKNIIFEIIIIDDKSSDNTVSEVKKLKNKLNLKITILINNHSKGLGNALLLGYNLSKYNFVMFLDADLSIKESDIYKLYKYRKKNSIIIGSRYIAKSKIIGVPNISSAELSTVILLVDISVAEARVVVIVNVLSNQIYPPPVQVDTTVTGSLIAFAVGSYVLLYNAICVSLIILA